MPGSDSASERAGTRSYDLLMVVVLAGVLVSYLATAATVESYGSDTSTYFELAKSLRHEHRYWFNFAPHTVYPPGYPLLLAGLMALGGEEFGRLVKLSIPIYFAGLLGVYWLVKLWRGPRTAFVVTLLGATSAVGYFWATVGLHSDVPYFALSVWGVLLVALAERAPTRGLRVAYLLLVSVCASYLVLLRTVGVTFVAGLLLWTLLPRSGASQGSPRLADRVKRWLPVAMLPVVALFVWSSWTGRQVEAPTDDYMQSYAQQLLKENPHQIDSPNITPLQLPGRLARMVGTRSANAARTVLNVPFLSLSWYHPLTLAVFLTVALGFLASLRRRRTVLECYLLAYGGLLLLYPFDEGTRYLFPIHPFLVLYGMDGLEQLREYGVRRGARVGGIIGAVAQSRSAVVAVRGALLAAIVGSGVYGIAARARANLDPDPTAFTHARTVEVARWVNQHTRHTDVIMHDEYQILHRLSGRKTLRFPLSTDPATITDRILASQVDYLVVLKERPFEYYNPSTMRRFEEVRRLHPRLFVPVHTFDQGTVYRLEPEAISALSRERPS